MEILPKYKITFYPNIPERTFVVDSKNFFPRYFIGLDGNLYEDYGLPGKPIWETVFDADFKIEIDN